MSDESKALAKVETQRALSAPMPVYSGEQMGQALEAYKGIQSALDQKMPDQILEIGTGKNKKLFRKKGYWRAVRLAFAIDLEMVSEELIKVPAPIGLEYAMPQGDWGYIVTYRATSSDGRSMVGDGSCMASEKLVIEKDWSEWRAGGKQGKVKSVMDKDGNPKIDKQQSADNATVHNVRAHAHTRAKNRAIADLVGFGEVSAEELPTTARSGGDNSASNQRPAQRQQANGKQAKPADVSPSVAKFHEWRGIIEDNIGKQAARDIFNKVQAWNGGKDKTNAVTVDAWIALCDAINLHGATLATIDEILHISTPGSLDDVVANLADWVAQPDPDGQPPGGAYGNE